MGNPDYKERLVLLDADTPELRGIKIDLITVYIILLDFTNVDFNYYFAFKQDEATGGSLMLLFILFKATNASTRDVIILPL